MTSNVHTILLSGGIGSGKSTVRTILESLGVPCYDADSAVKSFYKDSGDGHCLLPEIEALVGKSLRSGDGQLDRKAFAGIIFKDENLLRRVEDIVFPALTQDFIEWRERMGSAGHRTVVLESATALDKPNFKKVWDYCLWVDAPMETRIERVMQRDHCTREEVLRRLALQSPLEAHSGAIDCIIQNSGTPEQLKSSIETIFRAPARLR
ncbi:MAG: dephospho-CoA kinase [Candidatus Cryptobacteroides sp.]